MHAANAPQGGVWMIFRTLEAQGQTTALKLVRLRMSLCVCFQWISLMKQHMEEFVVYDLGHD